MLQQNNRQGQVRWYILGTLVALELLMSFSFLGYIHVEPISITTAYIPVLLAGVLLGPWEAMALGGVFGLASMWKATAHYVVNTDQLFSPTTSGNPFGSFVLSVVSRMLFGLLVGLLLQCFRNARLAGGWVALVAFLGPFLHALLVYGAMALCFPEAGYGPAVVVEDLGTPSDVVTKLVTMAIVLVVWRLDRSQRWNQFLFQVEAARKFSAGERYHRLSMVLVLIVTTCSAVAVAIYFVQRMNKVLSQEGIQLSETHYEDLLHLQIQFLIGILSMMALVIVFLIFNRRYATYKNAEAKRDALTGVMTRLLPRLRPGPGKGRGPGDGGDLLPHGGPGPVQGDQRPPRPPRRGPGPAGDRPGPAGQLWPQRPGGPHRRGRVRRPSPHPPDPGGVGGGAPGLPDPDPVGGVGGDPPHLQHRGVAGRPRPADREPLPAGRPDALPGQGGGAGPVRPGPGGPHRGSVTEQIETAKKDIRFGCPF